MSGPIERGVRADLRKLGIRANSGALVASAIKLAQLIDSGEIEDKSMAGIMRELRLTLAAITAKPGSDSDDVGGMQQSAAEKLQA